MLVVGVDVETTGLDTSSDRIIEFAYALWCTETGGPLVMESHMVQQTEKVVSETITKITGINSDMLCKYGKDLGSVLSDFSLMLAKHQIRHAVAYNGRNFDIPIIESEMKRLSMPIPSLIWIDPTEDLPYSEVMGRRKLVHMAADHGFLNPFPHRALFDVLTMLKILQQYPLSGVIERATSPTVVVRALIERDDVSGRELAKKKFFRFNELDGKKYDKQWVRKMKECDVPIMQKDLPFRLAIIAKG